MVGRGDGLGRNEAAAITLRTRRVMELAGSEAYALGGNVVRTEHILLGIIREGDGVAYRILQTLVGNVEAVRWRILEASGQEEAEISAWPEQVSRIEGCLNTLEHNLTGL